MLLFIPFEVLFKSKLNFKQTKLLTFFILQFEIDIVCKQTTRMQFISLFCYFGVQEVNLETIFKTFIALWFWDYVPQELELKCYIYQNFNSTMIF